MSPIAAVPAVGSASKDYKRESTLARLLGSGMSPELSRSVGSSSNSLQDLPVLLSLLSSIQYDHINTLYHESVTDPLKVDTIAKRLMSNQGKVGDQPMSYLAV
jgi:hypothetical protein